MLSPYILARLANTLEVIVGVYLELYHDPKRPHSLDGATYIVANGGGRSGNGPYELCHDCATLRSFERVIDQMHCDLEEIRKRAKRQFARLDAERAKRCALRDHMISGRR